MTTQQQPPETLTELKLNDELKKLINEAHVPKGFPMVMAHVEADGRPGISYRGSVVALGDTQLGLWARHASGGTVAAISINPNLTLVYREPGPPGQSSRAVITFRGVGRVVNSGDARRRVYEEMNERERNNDPEMNGVAIIVDLESISGHMPGFRLDMHK